MENNKLIIVKTLGILVVILLIIAGLFWINYSFVDKNPGANEFINRWNGVRQWLDTGLSPYSDHSSQLSQKLYYGRSAKTNIGEDPLDYLYPFQSVLIYSPFAWMDYSIARAIWMTINELFLLIISIVGIKLLDWKIKWYSYSAILLGGIVWFYSFQNIITSSIVPLCSLLLFSAILCIKKKQDRLAGLLLAFALIKPQFVLLPVIFTSIWSFLFRRPGIWSTLLLSLMITTGIGYILLPGWLPDWLLQVIRVVMASGWKGDAITAFVQAAPGITNQMIWFLSSTLYMYLVIEWIRNMKAEFISFYLGICITIIVSLIITPLNNSQHFAVLFPILILVGKTLNDRLGIFGRKVAVILYSMVIVGSWASFLGTKQLFGNDHFVLFLLPLLILTGLWWSRWWVIRSPNRFNELG